LLSIAGHASSHILNWGFSRLFESDLVESDVESNSVSAAGSVKLVSPR
jgi:hypothetical protein